MMEVLSSFETSVPTRVTQRDVPENGILHSHRRENLRSYKITISCLGIICVLRVSSSFYEILLVCSQDVLCGLVVKTSCLNIQRSRVRFPAVSHSLSIGSGTGSTQLPEDN
jgi:hypothetical protein